jgi:hypothetical protein
MVAADRLTVHRDEGFHRIPPPMILVARGSRQIGVAARGRRPYCTMT